MIWIVLDLIGLTAETSLIVVLGRRATGDDDSMASLVVRDGSLADRR